MSSGWLVVEGGQWSLVRIQEGGAELVAMTPQSATGGGCSASSLASALIEAGYRGQDPGLLLRRAISARTQRRSAALKRLSDTENSLPSSRRRRTLPFS